MGFILNNKVSQAGDGNGGFLNLNVSSAPYVPNYPSGLSGISGLLGWYDSSNANTSSILDEGGNVVSNGSSVATWKNLFLGATLGAVHLPDFTVNPFGSNPFYSTSQKYGPNQATGTIKNGIVFDGTSSVLQIADSSLVSLGTTFTWFYATPAMFSVTSTSGSVIVMSDTADFYANSVQQLSGGVSDPSFGAINDLFGAGVATKGGNKTSSMAQCGYVTVSSGIVSGLSVYYDGTVYKADNALTKGLTFTGLNQAISIAIPHPNPWNFLSLGGAYYSDGSPLNSFFAGPIGEVLVYQGTPTAQNVKDILQYLITRWS